jgi:hypothetical protein
VLNPLANSSSVESRGVDIKLDVRFVNIGLGGRRPETSNEPLAARSGEPVKDMLTAGDGWGRLS